MSEIVLMLLEAVIPILAALIGWLVHRGAGYLKRKTDNEWAMGVIKRLEMAIAEAVQGVQATVVDGIKEAKADGKLTAEEAKAIKQQAIEAVKELVGPNVLRDLIIIFGLSPNLLDSWIGRKIESYLFRLKAASS